MQRNILEQDRGLENYVHKSQSQRDTKHVPLIYFLFKIKSGQKRIIAIFVTWETPRAQVNIQH